MSDEHKTDNVITHNQALLDDVTRVAADGPAPGINNVTGTHPADILSDTERREMYEWFVHLMSRIPTCPQCGSDLCIENTMRYMERSYKALVGPHSVIMMLMALLNRLNTDVTVTSEELQTVAQNVNTWMIEHTITDGNMTMGLRKPVEQEGEDDEWPDNLDDSTIM